MPYQYGNEANPLAHYNGTAVEILEELDEVAAFVGGLGTGGTLMGNGRRLKEDDPETLIVAAEPMQGELVQGLRSLDDGFIPPIIDLSLLDRKIMVSNRDAIVWTKQAARRGGHLRRRLRRRDRRDRRPHRRRARRRQRRLPDPRRRLEVPLLRRLHEADRGDREPRLHRLVVRPTCAYRVLGRSRAEHAAPCVDLLAPPQACDLPELSTRWSRTRARTCRTSAAGWSAARDGEATEVIRVANAAASPLRYEMDPQEQYDALKAIEDGGERAAGDLPLAHQERRLSLADRRQPGGRLAGTDLRDRLAGRRGRAGRQGLPSEGPEDRRCRARRH